MPDLDSPIHLNMLEQWRRRQKKGQKDTIYGLHWGDPEASPPLQSFRERFLRPYVNNAHTALEIGPGGGRWTRYMLDFGRLYLVDLHKPLLEEVQRNFPSPNIVAIHNSGRDFPGVPDGCVDFLFSFGVFVHLDAPIIEGYLASMRRVLAPTGSVVLQYSDKRKPAAQKNPGFSDNNPDKMREMVRRHGYNILEEDEELLHHSAVIRFGLA